PLSQALGAARMSGELSGMWDASLLSPNWASSSAAATIVRFFGAVAIVVGLKRESKVITSFGVAAVVASFALTGHTRTHTPQELLAILLIIHLSMIVFWFGALPALVTVAKRESSVLVIEKFSKHATILVPCLAIAGLAMALFLLPNIAALATPYGIALVVKVNSFLVLMLLAALNKLRFVPAMQRGDRSAFVAFARTATVEYAIIVIVLCVTATMTTLFSPD
ncbi:MAG TPA: CopD family protein, partial [Steroidobacteraceae bacterium]|nr:CopD family protein [Steroidobacteraceae bacterium]